ncbi:amidohydrolase family protein [Croceitalea sp. MTPC5]|uniref:amidohydrolase family protein n=1 Tax=Croceitalea sp. MTPC5 TaxID=3056565 RepID=UPI002B398075|nr:amidohydrolase family protein [Croceitalea sp. MTPC5]
MGTLKYSKSITSLIAVLFFVHSNGQETFPKNDVSDRRPNAFALTHATIVVDPATILNDATLVLRDGVIEAVVSGAQVPKGYTEIDYQGRYIYPSFIDIFSNYGQPEVVIPKRGSPYVKREQIQSNTKGAYNANEAIKASYDGAEHFEINEKMAEKLRSQGFGTVATMRPDGIARGTAALVVLGDGRENNMLIKPKVAAHYSFDKGSSTQDYPVSPMGSIALLRQTFYDAQWYGGHSKKPFTDLSLEALVNNKKLPQIIETEGWLTALRAYRLGKEFDIDFIIKGGGDEYQRIEEITEMNAPLVIPIHFPKDYDITDPHVVDKISLADLKHWELAPTNPSRLEKAGVRFAVTAHPTDNSNDFLKNLRKSVTYGLSKKKALSALTTTPSAILKVDDIVGTLAKGKLANFIITDGDLFDEKTALIENWVKGNRFMANDLADKSIVGEYSLEAGNLNATLNIQSKNLQKYEGSIVPQGGSKEKMSFTMERDVPVLEFKAKGSTYSLTGWMETVGDKTVLKGTGTIDYEKEIRWAATKIQKVLEEVNDKTGQPEQDTASLGKVFFPFMAFGTPEKIASERILITNATVWTNEDEGVLSNTDVMLEEGKIAKIGINLSANDANVIDGTGKHLTAGLIDEHSHIAISAVNEITTNSGMVRMGDVLDSEDASIYRALAGGVVAAHILHGSSDPIGGQSSIIKLKWGVGPEELKIKKAAPFIKFALGENPKRSKSAPSIRFPRSLMGLEQFYANAFTEALDYKKSWRTFDKAVKKRKNTLVRPRKDLVNEAMLEIIEGKRFISAHSYQQKEMMMLMDVAERFGFTVNTFTHALEGYRIADKMVEHGVGGSTFSDKWNFKWETRNAIPYNATIMNNEGVLTAINSDSRETIRHLNHEAAKSIKYGGSSKENALKMITLNPAKLLHLDDTMGSIKVGKSADVVLWSGPPLSLYSKPEKTIIEGTIYFDIERDKQLRKANQKEKSRILKKMGSGDSDQRPTAKISNTKPEFDCEYIEMDH